MPDEYRGDIPAQGYMTDIRYYIEAEDSNGVSAVSPTAAPDGVHSFRVLGRFQRNVMKMEASTTKRGALSCGGLVNYVVFIVLPAVALVWWRRRAKN